MPTALALSLLLVWAPLPAQPGDGQTAGATVQTVMRHVDFHVDRSIILHIDSLRGELRPVKPPFPILEDKASFVLRIDTGRIALSTSGLSDLLNRYVFSYRNSPLRRVRVSIVDGRLEQRGVIHGIPFAIRSDLSVTPAGALRLRPVSIKALGIGVTGLMRFFGIQLEGLLNLDERGTRGLRVDGNDLFLEPAKLLPAPLAEGRLASLILRDTLVIQIFRPAGTGATPSPLLLPPAADPGITNYMYFSGGSLRFGHLTMTPTDLLIQDADPRDPFDFDLDHYLDQLVAGFSRNTPINGLITMMPDFNDLPARKRTGGRTP